MAPPGNPARTPPEQLRQAGWFAAEGRPRREVWHRVTMPQPPPSTRQVRAWLDDWELPAPPRVQPLTGGFTSHVWRIDVGESVYVAKLAYQPPADLENGLLAAAVSLTTGYGPAQRSSLELAC